jgi:hypothetical protein
MIKIHPLMKRLGIASAAVVVSASLVAGGVAHAIGTGNPPTPTNKGNKTSSSSTSTSSGSSSSSSANSAAQQQKLKNIITKGDQEIERRLTNMNAILPKIKASTKLTSSDQSTLTNEVETTISGLQTLKTQLDSSTTVSSAVTAAQQMYTEYRVYALVLPKIDLVKTADDQQITEAKLATFVQTLQTRLTAAQNAGKDVSSLQADLTSMNSEVTAAEGISSNIESTVINLQPSDYDSNHSVLSGDSSQLKTALSDEQSAYNNAKTIVEGLMNLKTT